MEVQSVEHCWCWCYLVEQPVLWFSTSTSSNMFQIPKFAAQVVLSYMEVQSVTHCWRWWNLVEQPVLLFLDQFSTELPAFNMLALLVGIAVQHIILKSRFWPPGFPSTVLCPTTSCGWAAPTSPPTGETSQPQNSISMQLQTQFELIANIPQPYTYAYSAARAPGAKPDRQIHFQYCPALSTRFSDMQRKRVMQMEWFEDNTPILIPTISGSRSVVWLVIRLDSWFAGWLDSWFAGWSKSWFAGWLVGWLIVSRSQLVGGWLVGSIMMPTLSSHRPGSSYNCMFQAGSLIKCIHIWPIFSF